MERREQGPQGFKYSDEVRQKVMEAFGFERGTTWMEEDWKLSQMRRTLRFIDTIERRASMEGLTPRDSVELLIIAHAQENKDDLAHKATKAGFKIEQSETDQTFSSMRGKIALERAPDLAISMFKNPDTLTVELKRRLRRKI